MFPPKLNCEQKIICEMGPRMRDQKLHYAVVIMNYLLERCRYCSSVSCRIYRRLTSATNGASARANNNTSTPAGGAGSSGGAGGAGGARAPQRPRGRVVRAAVGRGRGSGVIVGTRPLVPASVVPEELINQVRDGSMYGIPSRCSL